MLRITDIVRMLKRSAGREIVQYEIAGAAAATAANYTVPLSAKAVQPSRIVSVTTRYVTASTGGTLQVRKCGPGVAVASGTDVLANTIDLSATADTNYNGVLSTTDANLIVRPGDCLYLVAGGTLTSLSGIGVRIVLQNLTFAEIRDL